jgi:hypothetical protein
MRLRMYLTLPDLDSARRLADDLLLARVEDRHMHFLARRGTNLGELHEASYLEKTDAWHGAFTGLVLGGAIGALVGFALVQFPPGRMLIPLAAVLAAAIVGGLLGAWVATMVGLQVPNSRLKAFEADIAAGKILLMLDVPARRRAEVAAIIGRTHPEAIDRGDEPTVPAFP